MNRATRDKITSGTGSDLLSGNACWETPPEVFAKLVADFGPFDLDLTADPQRHLCPKWFGPGSPMRELDALDTDWVTYGRNGFSNPPYGSFVQKILKKAVEQQTMRFTTTLLLPMRVTKAFKEQILPWASELLYCDSRIVFYENGEPRWNQKILAKTGRHVPDAAVFDSIIVRFLPQRMAMGLRVGLWEVPVHGKWKPEYEKAS